MTPGLASNATRVEQSDGGVDGLLVMVRCGRFGSRWSVRWCSECWAGRDVAWASLGLGRSAPERDSPHSLRTTLLCVVRITDDDHRQRAGSSPGEGSPWAEREVLAVRPHGRSWTNTRPPELVASRAGDLTPWSAGGSWHDSTGAPSSLWADSGRSPAGQGEGRHRSREVERWLPRRIGHSFTLSRRMERTPCRHPPRGAGRRYPPKSCCSSTGWLP